MTQKKNVREIIRMINYHVYILIFDLYFLCYVGHIPVGIAIARQRDTIQATSHHKGTWGSN